MTYTATRTCTEVPAGGLVEGVSGPLAKYREVPAYVLLGDPGSGKTTELEQEAEAVGEGALLVSARDFLTFLPENRPEWRSRTLFIDGLDEVRVGQSDARTRFDAIRGRLDALGDLPSGSHVELPTGWGQQTDRSWRTSRRMERSPS